MSAEHKFPKDFLWGAATCSYVFEGAAWEDGKGESIWDRFCAIPGKILNGDKIDVACDHYHRYKEDVAIMKEMGLGAYRFSISWPRIFPEGKGAANPRGLDFYRRLCESLLEVGIKPAATIYHWDLPARLQDAGGWANRDTAKHYRDYAACLFEKLGDLVPMWITHNEPWCVAFLGNGTGHQAPGIKDYKVAVQVSHHLLLSHGLAVEAFRQSPVCKTGTIGITLNLSPIHARSASAADEAARRRQDAALNRWFLDPIFKAEYPAEAWQWYERKGWLPEMAQGDLELVAQPLDFLGINYYNRGIVYDDPQESIYGLSSVCGGNANEEKEKGIWYPQGLRELLIRIKQDYGDIPQYITENGWPVTDTLDGHGHVNDEVRIKYIREHLVEAARALEQGVDLRGYFVWSLTDNFESAYGYSSRFGLIYIDYADLKRIWKKSAYWYRDVIRNNAV